MRLGAIQASPLLAGRLAQLEDHGVRGHAAEATRSPTPDIAAITDNQVQSYPHGAKWSLELVFFPDQPVSSDSYASPR